jgi:tRNA(Ile)-lysidine synthase
MVALMDLLSRVLNFVRRNDLIAPGSRVIAAVSGGSDSIALLHILRELADAGELSLVGVAHFNHELRAAADADQRFVEEIAALLDRPCFAEREDVRARATSTGDSLELAARKARYEFYDRARRHYSADLVALGHTRDDQAETVLMRLMRGAGPRGLAGMHPKNGQIVRPLLDCRREGLRAWLGERRLRFVEDESNADVGIPRNRVRRELIPLLERRFNPAIVDVLADQADVSRETWMWMEAAAADLEGQIVRRSTTSDAAAVCEIELAGLMRAPLAVRRALVWRLMTEVSGGRSIAFDHVTSALRLMDERLGTRVDFPGHRLERIGHCVVLTGRVAGAAGRPAADTPPNSFRFPLSIPGEVTLPSAGWVVSAQAAGGATVSNDGVDAVQVRFDGCAGGWAVRNRRPGDRFRPVGLDGQKKLQDYFVDRKVARRQRDLVPLVVDADDRIVWVAGYGIDEAFRVTDRTQEVITLTLKVLGGSA